MDTRTGDIYPNRKVLADFLPLEETHLAKEMKMSPMAKQLNRKPVDPNAIGRLGRNEKCPCGSDKKFKYCCLNV